MRYPIHSDDNLGNAYGFIHSCECHGLSYHLYFKSDEFGLGVLAFIESGKGRVFSFDISQNTIIGCEAALAGMYLDVDGFSLERYEPIDFMLPLAEMTKLFNLGVKQSIAEEMICFKERIGMRDIESIIHSHFRLAEAHQRLFEAGEALVDQYIEIE